MLLMNVSLVVCVHFQTVAMDVGRALLKFAAGYPLGERGMDWLKIHIITLHGAKKKSVIIYTLGVVQL